VVFPRPKTFYQSVIERRGPDNSDKEAVGQTLARILQMVQPVARQLDAVGINSKNIVENDIGQDDKGQDDVLRMNQVPNSR
jgi:hypothetical protein